MKRPSSNFQRCIPPRLLSPSQHYEAQLTQYSSQPSVNTSTKLLRASNALNIPAYITTQNRGRLGPTVPKLQEHLTGPNVRADIDKTLFSMITPEIDALLPIPAKGETPIDAIMMGIETHICITQTTLDLLERGHRVYIIVDGVSSINSEERVVALARLRDAGAIVTTSESIMFEILRDAGDQNFKTITGLVKETKEETKEALDKLSKI